MPNYLDYQKSVAQEFKAYENRVRNLIDDAHWGEDGRYKEIILMNYLNRVLPKNISAGTGFVRNNNEITSQIDIIIYDNTFPLLFSEGDFVVATPDNVLGIVEVKTRIRPSKICDIIKTANKNGSIIARGTDNYIFNGIFSFNCSNNLDSYIINLSDYNFTELLKINFNEIAPPAIFNCVNHIALDNRYFIKLWPLGQGETIGSPYYSIYDFPDGLAFSYFLSNLQESSLRKNSEHYGRQLPEELESLFYPITKGKEEHLIERIYLT